MAIEPIHHPNPAVPPPHWELLASIFNHASDGIFVLDDQLRVIL